LGYKKYYDNDTESIYWKLNGPGWNSCNINEADASAGRILKIQEFVKHVDTSKEYWENAKGALIGAGAAGVVSAVLFLLPEPFASKAAAVAAITAAGASASAALASGGYFYTSSKYYKKAEEAYDNL